MRQQSTKRMLQGSGNSLYKWLFLEWILQNKAGHLIMFTQRGILNRDGTDLDKNKAENCIELHFGSKHPFWGFSTDLHYLGLSTDLKRLAVICSHG